MANIPTLSDNLRIKIREARPSTKQRRLRLIHSGRILADNVVFHAYLANSEDRRRQRTDSKARSGGESSSNAGRDLVWLHCAVGAESSGSEEEAEVQVRCFRWWSWSLSDPLGIIQQAQIKPLRGFERLIAAGFSEDDVANFRRTFHSQSSENYLDMEPLGDDEDCTPRISSPLYLY